MACCFCLGLMRINVTLNKPFNPKPGLGFGDQDPGCGAEGSGFRGLGSMVKPRNVRCPTNVAAAHSLANCYMKVYTHYLMEKSERKGYKS